ncbi:MAG: hypothetical protein HY704_08280 [Gemmatimonadetes bacterium]|nr:hypothetical protein [Gemmatimonadota bacterium]
MPTGAERRRFVRVSDWHDLLNEAKQSEEGINLYELRQACYRDIERLRGRPLLVYGSQFIPPPHPRAPVTIDLEDIDGFTDLINAVEEDVESVDVLVHSPGGSPEATERIVDLLRARFRQVTFLVPHSAYSAATMLALSGNEIILHPSASLGPIDPQINGTPARSIRRGFDRVRDLLKREGPEALPAYLPLIEKHSLEVLEICDDSEKLARELASDWLGGYMFGNEPESDEKAGKVSKIVSFFANYDDHKTHSRPLTFRKIKDLGLKLTQAEEPLRSLLREAHILLNGFLTVTTFVKLYENSGGLSWGRQFQLVPGSEAPKREEQEPNERFST